jgi:DNA repair protein SbcC/Rad50
MRPIRLELEGFTAYREITVCDFDGVDLFVLTGPTGSGKSSLIDAITFALYGSVSRYGNPNLVHPVISQGKLEAKVRFDFSLAGRRYTAVRVVRRTKGGATTREARLESEGKTLAGNAEEVSRMVRKLLGLNFEQFNTCVVLPQGEFARFLNEKPAERQDLLTKLLGVDVYERMGALARFRESEAKQKTLLYQGELVRMADVSEAARKAAKHRVSDLEKVKREIESAEPELEALRVEAERLVSEATRLEVERKLLSGLSAPEGALGLAKEIRDARQSAAAATRKRETAENTLASAERARDVLGDEAGLRALDSVHRDLEDRRARLVDIERESAGARKALDAREKEKTHADEEERRGRDRIEGLRRDLAAHDLRGHLSMGEPCPVCERTVETLPEASRPPALSSAQKALEKSSKARQEAERAWQQATKDASVAVERAESLRAEIERLETRLAKAPSATEIASTLDAMSVSDGELTRARKEATAARENERRAQREVERVSEEEARGWSRFDATRDAVSFLRPPAAPRDDLALAWEGLLAWVRDELPRHEAKAGEVSRSAKEASETREKRLDELEARCRIVDVNLARERPRDAVVTALAKAEQELDRITHALERVRCLRDGVQEEQERARIAGALGQHLRANGFERWLLEEAFRRLVGGATTILKELSSGQYSFEYDGLNFEVIDHRNADERRSARTLSGGETFLASLALALTLAEQTAELAAETFTMGLMGRRPGIRRIGENTQGVFSDVLDRRLPNGWRLVLPNEIYVTAAGKSFDVTGVPPDVAVAGFSRKAFGNEKDPGLETALALLASH